MSPSPDLLSGIRRVLERHPAVQQAILFGSLAAGRAGPESDLDLAVAAQGRPLDRDERMSLIGDLAELAGRPIDLVDLHTTAGPLLGQVLRHGIRVLGSDAMFGDLLSRHLIDEADFLPLRNRILDERRRRWIGI